MGASHQALLMAGASTPAWSPADLFGDGRRGCFHNFNNLATLWENSNGTTQVDAAGDPCGRADDLSGNGHHVTQATSGKRPLIQNDGACYYSDYDGTDDVLSAGTTVDLAARTDDINVVMCLKFDTTSGDLAPLARSLANSEQGRYWFGMNSSSLNANYQSSAAATSAAVSDTDTTKRIVSMTINRVPTGAGTVKLYSNGVEIASSTTSFSAESGTDRTNLRRFLLGAFNNATDTGEVAFFNGRIYGQCTWFAAVDTAEREQVEEWMADEYGVTL